MKRGLLIFSVIVLISLNLFSCGGNKSSEATATEDQASTSEEASIDCGQLVQDYEKYANDFEVSVRKWKADPSDEIAAAQIEDLSAKIEEVGGKITSNGREVVKPLFKIGEINPLLLCTIAREKA